MMNGASQGAIDSGRLVWPEPEANQGPDVGFVASERCCGLEVSNGGGIRVVDRLVGFVSPRKIRVIGTALERGELFVVTCCASPANSSQKQSATAKATMLILARMKHHERTSRNEFCSAAVVRLDPNACKNYQNLVDSRERVFKGKGKMKTKVVTVLLVLAICTMFASPASAVDDLDMVGDIVLVRPACLVATVIGSAIFVISLPIALSSRSVRKSAHTFVVRPARATFTRPLGNLEELEQ